MHDWIEMNQDMIQQQANAHVIATLGFRKPTTVQNRSSRTTLPLEEKIVSSKLWNIGFIAKDFYKELLLLLLLLLPTNVELFHKLSHSYISRHFNVILRELVINTLASYTSTGVLISPQPDQEGNNLRSMSGTRTTSTTSRRELSSRFFFPARQGAEGNSHHSDRNISLFPSCSG